MVELRRERGLAQEALGPSLQVLAGVRAQDLHDRLALERALLGEVHVAEAAATDELAQREITERALDERAPLGGHVERASHAALLSTVSDYDRCATDANQ